MPSSHRPIQDPVDFRAVFETSQDILALVAPDAPDFTILAVSLGHVRASRRSRSELVGRGFFEVYSQDGTDDSGPEELRAAFEQLLRDKATNAIGSFRYDLPDPASPDRFHECYWSPQNFPIFGTDGQIRYILHRVEDVTDFVLRDRYQVRPEPFSGPPSGRILVAAVDDERRGYLQGLLGSRWEVTAVASAGQALEAVDAAPPDLVVTGGSRSDQDDIALLRGLRAKPGESGPPVIVALDRPDPQQFRAAMEAGADEVVSGQASARELMARAEAQMTRSELRRTLLEQASGQFRRLFMQAPFGIALLEGPEHTITLSNPAHDQMVEDRPLVGLRVREAFPEASIEPFIRRLDQVYATGEPFFADEVAVDFRPPGTEVTVRKFLTQAYLPYRALNGEVEGVAAFQTDVTEAVETRKALEQEGMRKEGIARLGEMALWNPPLQDLFDQATRCLNELLGTDLTKVLEWLPEEGQLLLRSGTGWREGEVGSTLEPDAYGSPGGYTLLTEEPVFVADLATEERFAPSSLLSKHGAVSGMAMVIRGAGRPFGVLAAFTRTARTFASDEMHFMQALANVLAASIQRATTEASLRRSEAQFREMADRLPILIWMQDADGEQELVNQTLCDFFGVPREEMTGDRWQDFLHPADAEGYTREYFRCHREQRPFHAETRVRRSDGEWRLLEVWGQPRFSESEEFQGMVGGCVDITEQRAAEEELREADRRKKDFLALLGHELRNPLTPIANMAQLLELQNETMDPQQLDQLAAVLSRQSDHLTRIVDDLLDLSRLDHNRLTLQKEIVDVRELVPQAVESIPDLRERGPEGLTQALPEHPLLVHGDRVRLTQALTNLLDNAAKHTPRDAEIRIEATREDGVVVVRVQDRGVGIDPAFLPQLFEPFERGPDRDSQLMGLGLGLPLVKRLVELHEGSVEADSPGAGRGCTFTLRLPVRERTEGEEPAGASAVETIESGQVLLVEDNEDVARSLEFLLEGLGQEVRRAASGQEAMEVTAQSRPALIYIDIGLPDMTGFEVARKLRGQLGAVPLVALSGHPASDFPDQPTEVFDEYLLKPPTLEGLQQTLARKTA